MRSVPTAQTAQAFVRRHTEPVRIALLPELTLNLAREPFGIFEAAERIAAERPYWAFAWSGGQALARWIMDHGEAVAGRRVLDIGAGSGLGAIAAVHAGARLAVANDTDQIACAAARLNAATNGVDLTISGDDLLGAEPDADVVLIGDLFYEPDLVTRVTSFLERTRRRSATVYFGDRATSRRPPIALDLVAEYDAPLTPDMEIDYVERARVWRVAS